MTPWLLFGAGGKGVGARTLDWRWRNNVRSLLSFVMLMPPRNWRNKAYRFLQATPVMPA